MSSRSKDHPHDRGGSANVDRWLVPAISVVLASAVFALYARTAAHEFVYDDFPLVVENPYVTGGITWEGIRQAFGQAYFANWQPFTWISHMVDVEMFGMAPAGHHLVSVALHAVNAVLLFVAVRTLTGTIWPSAVVAALFAVHPLRVESVAWVAERKGVLSTTFFMATILAYACYVRRPTPRRYLVVMASFAGGLLTKQMLVTLPGVLLLLDVWPLGRLPYPGAGRLLSTAGPRDAAVIAPAPVSRLLIEKLPLLALSVAGSVATLLAQRAGGALRSADYSPFGARLCNAILAYVGYLWKTIYPMSLACFYPRATMEPALLSGPVLGAAFLLGGITAVALYWTPRRPYLAVGWLWYLGTLVPVIGLVQVGDQAMADRYTYIPLIGVYIMVVWGARDLLSRRSRAVRLLVAALPLTVYSALTWMQVETWRDSRTLWTHALRVTTGNYIAHHNLGQALLRTGDPTGAAAQFELSLQVRPNFPAAHNSLGTLRLQQGRLDEAAAHFRRAIDHDPGWALAHTNLGLVHLQRQELDEAILQFEAALRGRPVYKEIAATYTNLGVVLLQQGDLEGAARNFEHALRYAPGLADAHNNLGVISMHRGDTAEATRQFEAALRTQPDHANANANLGGILLSAGRIHDARVLFEKALRSDPTNAAARDGLLRTRGHQKPR